MVNSCEKLESSDSANKIPFVIAAVSEAAVVGVPDEMTGQALLCFVSVKDSHKHDSTLNVTAKSHIRKAIGGFAAPKFFIVVSDIPKTRSGKIMRRILRKIFEGEKENFGDVSTVSDVSSVSVRLCTNKVSSSSIRPLFRRLLRRLRRLKRHRCLHSFSFPTYI